MSIAENIQYYREAIAKGALKSGRAPESVRLLAISKKYPPEAIQEAFDAGVTEFGESYWQEARDKQQVLTHLPITWHFVGPIQSNKAKYIAKNFDWVHSVATVEVAKRLNQARSEHDTPLNICIQVNLDNDPSKSGVTSKNELSELAEYIQALPHLRLRGLMIIPEKKDNPSDTYHTFLMLKQHQDELNQSFGLTLDTLSMGMTKDFSFAIDAGSTYIRIGRGIFNHVKL